jgi:hypothetical protein
VTYSFFFFLLMQADSLFLIIRCCRFMFLNCNTERKLGVALSQSINHTVCICGKAISTGKEGNKEHKKVD